MRKLNLGIFLLMAALTTLSCCLSRSASAAPRSWTGFANNSWSNTLNWDPVGIIQTNDNIYIGDLQPNATVGLGQTQTIASLDLSNQAEFEQIYSTRQLNVTGAMTLEDSSTALLRNIEVEDLLILDQSTVALESISGSYKANNTINLAPGATLMMGTGTKIEAGATSGKAINIDGTIETRAADTTIQAISGGTIDLDGNSGNSHLKLISEVPNSPTLTIDGPLSDAFDGTVDLAGNASDDSTLNMTHSWTAGTGSILNMDHGRIAGATATFRGLMNATGGATIEPNATFLNNLVQIADSGWLTTEGSAGFSGVNVTMGGSLGLAGGGSIMDTVIHHAVDSSGGGVLSYRSGLTIGGNSDIDVDTLWSAGTNSPLSITGGDITAKNWGPTDLDLTGGTVKVVDTGSIQLPGGLSFGSAEFPKLNIEQGSTATIGPTGNGDLTMGFLAGEAAELAVKGIGSVSPGTPNRQSELSAGNARIGNRGQGYFLVRDGGRGNFSGNVKVGEHAGALGLLAVDGAVDDGTEVFQSEVYVGNVDNNYVANLEVGNTGEGYVNVLNGGRLAVNGDARFGQNAGGAGNLTIATEKLGRESYMSVNGDLHLGGNGSATADLFEGGVLSANSLQVHSFGQFHQNGGVLATQSLNIAEGTASIAAGTAYMQNFSRTGDGTFNHTGGEMFIQGGTAEFNNSYSFDGPDPINQPRLNIESGTDATVTYGFRVGDLAGRYGQVRVAGATELGRSTLRGTGGGAGADLHVGRFGSGGLHIEDGGYVKILDDTLIASEADSFGVVSVLGTKELPSGTIHRAELDVTGRGAQSSLYIGQQGHGVLSLSDGGLVRVAGSTVVAPTAGSRGELYVYNEQNGISALLDIAGNLNLGGDGEASMYLYDGGHVKATNLVMGNNSQITMTGGFLELATLDATNGVTNFTGGTVDVDTVLGDVNLENVTVLPGDSPGLMEILGAATFKNTLLEIELGGTTAGKEHDQLFVQHELRLDGLLDIRLYDFGSGFFSPNLGDEFTILTSKTGITGEFDAFDGDSLPAGLQWELEYRPSEVVLRAVSSGEFDSADFDFDGDVDEADLARWEAKYGGAGPDADGDGLTAGSDFLAWQRQYTGSAAPMLSTATVPEPAGLVLMLMGLVGVMAVERTK